MTRRSLRPISKRVLDVVFVVLALIGACQLYAAPHVFADPLEPRSITVSDNQAASAGVTYKVDVAIAAATTGSIAIQFCGNSPLVGTTCTPPSGFDATAANLTIQSGATGFTISPSSTANDIILTRPPANSGAVSASYTFTNITNPTSEGSLFGRISTYSSSDATGLPNEEAGLAMVITGGLGLNAEVPPYLTFCLGGSITGFDCTTATDPFSDLGDLTSLAARAAQTQLVVATNAANGYTMWAAGTTMTSGNNTIAPMGVLGPSQPGTPQFGMNLRANSAPVVGADAVGPGVGAPTANFNQPNFFFFHSGDALASSTNSDDFRKYTASYIVNIPSSQPGGVYSTTLTYVCLANF